MSRMGLLCGRWSDRAANKNNKPVSRRRTKQHALKGSLAAPLFIWLWLWASSEWWAEAQPADHRAVRWSGDVKSRDVFALGWALARQ